MPVVVAARTRPARPAPAGQVPLQAGCCSTTVAHYVGGHCPGGGEGKVRSRIHRIASLPPPLLFQDRKLKTCHPRPYPPTYRNATCRAKARAFCACACSLSTARPPWHQSILLVERAGLRPRLVPPSCANGASWRRITGMVQVAFLRVPRRFMSVPRVTTRGRSCCLHVLDRHEGSTCL